MASDKSPNADATATIKRLLAGGWVAQIIQAAAELGLADYFGDDAQDAETLAGASGTHTPSLARLLRALAAIGIVDEHEGRRYTLTALGATLRTNQPGSMRAWARQMMREATERPWRELTHAVRTGDNAFEHIFGTDIWTYRSTHSDFSALFNDAMRSITQGVNATIGTEYPFGNFAWVVDIGGGTGSLLLPILGRYGTMRGTIVELPHVTAQTRESIKAAGLADRCNAVEGDARSSEIPAGADAYILKLVLHGQTDDDAVAILRNCRDAMLQQAKLLIIERVLPEQVDPQDVRLQTYFISDVNMMLVPGGRERTEREYRHLLSEAGLRFNRVVETSSMTEIVEAER